MSVVQGTVNCGTSATKLCTTGESGALVFASATGVFIGGPNVAISGANAGVPLPATTYVTIPGARTIMSGSVPAGPDNTCDYYIISSAGTQTVAFIAPQGG